MRSGACAAAAAAAVACVTLSLPASARPQDSDAKKETAVTRRATGTFDVQLTPQADEGSPLGRMLLDKTFSGGLQGTSKGQMLAAGTAVKDSAGYVALEQFTGTLDGRSGTFILQHSGRMARGVPSLAVTVVPDSGTGQLLGLAGTMTIRIEGAHYYEIEYTLPEIP